MSHFRHRNTWLVLFYVYVDNQVEKNDGKRGGGGLNSVDSMSNRSGSESSAGHQVPVIRKLPVTMGVLDKLSFHPAIIYDCPTINLNVVKSGICKTKAVFLKHRWLFFVRKRNTVPIKFYCHFSHYCLDMSVAANKQVVNEYGNCSKSLIRIHHASLAR